MNKTTKALKLAEAVISRYRKETPIGNQPHMICHVADEALAAIREVLAEQALQNLSNFHQHMEETESEYYDCGGTIGVVHKSQCSAAMKRNGKPWKCACGANLYIDSNGAPVSKVEPKCSDHPDAPHGFDRNASHNAGRYVCECEGWSPDEVVKYPGCDYCNDKLFSGRKCKCCGKVFIENVEQEIDDLRQQNAALKAVVDAWNNVEPVKQGPVAYAPIITFRDSQLYQVSKQLTPEFCNPLYAAPVDAKSIRAEAMRDAVKFVERKEDEYRKRNMQGYWELCAGLIADEMRRLK